MPAYRFRITLGPEYGHRQVETTTGPHPGPKSAEGHVRWQYPTAESIEPLGEELPAEVAPPPGVHPDEAVVAFAGVTHELDGTHTLERIPGTDTFTNTPHPEADESGNDRHADGPEIEARGGAGDGAPQ